MATAADEDTSISNYVTCGNCLEGDGYLENPKRLACGHTFCEPCLQGRQQDAAGREITCNICQQVPIADIENIQSALDGDQTFCDPCKESDEKTVSAKSYCSICDSKLCNTHQEMHKLFAPKHNVILIKDYLASSVSREIKSCDKHKSEILSIGCGVCLKVICTKCLSAIGACKNGKEHRLLSLNELAAELRLSIEPLKHEVENRFEDLSALVKEVTIVQSQWQNDTDRNIRLLQKLKQDQIKEIEENYARISAKYLESRSESAERVEEFMVSEASVKLAELNENLKSLRADLSHEHVVDLVKERARIELSIQTMMSEKFPSLLVENQLEIKKTSTANRGAEAEVKNAETLWFSIRKDQVPVALELHHEHQSTIPNGCISTAAFSKGFSYFGQYPGIITRSRYFDSDSAKVESYLTMSSQQCVVGLRIHNNLLILLIYGQPYQIHVYAMVDSPSSCNPKLMAQWHDTNRKPNWCGCRMAVVQGQLLVIDTGNKRIRFYDLPNGLLSKTLPCGNLVGDSYVSMCEADDTSLIISDRGTGSNGKVSWFNIITEERKWVASNVGVPQGVVFDPQRRLVYVAAYAKHTEIWMLNAESGEVIGKLTDESFATPGLKAYYTMDLCLRDNDILVVPKYHEKTVTEYRLKHS